MAFTPNNNLSDTYQDVSLRDWQHASKLFNTDQFRLAPKFKFLFHVAFGINKSALTDQSLVERYGSEINMLVKSIELPSYTVQTEVLNQYNRKKVVQYQHTPGEIGIKFHDDNMGLINFLWQNYYKYYYADANTANTSGAFNRNATKNQSTILGAYGFDNGSTTPFFSYIKIYQMARHEYFMYQLWNPVITSWNHNKLDYAQNVVHDFDMKLKYEAVSYDTGTITSDAPEGFGMSHYDTTISPLGGQSAPGIGFSNITAVQELGPDVLSQAIQQVNSYQNTTPLANTSAATGSPSTSTTQTQNTNGVPGTSFPGTTNDQTSIQATPSKA